MGGQFKGRATLGTGHEISCVAGELICPASTISASRPTQELPPVSFPLPNLVVSTNTANNSNRERERVDI